jgi:hypothetical protein
MMKKITLAFYAAVLFGFGLQAQSTYELVAPPDMNGTSSFRAPNGTAAHTKHRALFFIHPYEMLPMNMATINSCSFQINGGTGSIDVPGSFTLYLANSPAMFVDIRDGSTNFNTVFGSMQKAFVGTYTVPSTPGSSTVGLNFTTPFNYTGGGLLVGMNWASTGPFAANGATYTMCYQFDSFYDMLSLTSWMGTAESTGATISGTVQAVSAFRPSMIWGAVNTATNEVELVNIDVEGSVPAMFSTSQSIRARVVNSSVGAVSDVSVAFSAVGANPHQDTIVINAMPAGSSQTISFPYNPTVAGESTITVTSLYADQNLANNSKAYTQSVTCGNAGHSPSTYSVETAYGYGGSVHVTHKHKFPVTTTLTGVRMRIGDDNSNTSKPMSPVLLNSTGGVVAQGPAVIISPSVTIDFPFSTPQVLNANQNYFIGITQPSNAAGYFPFAFSNFTPYVTQPAYVFNVTNPSTVSAGKYYGGYFMIEPLLENTALNYTATASRTFACKGESITLTAEGGAGMSYTWNPGSKVGDQITVTVQPVGSQTGSPVFITVVGTHTASQCQTEASIVTVSVNLCTGIGEEMADYSGIEMFPNPAESGVTRLQGLQGKNKIEVISITGQCVQQFESNSEQAIVDLSSLPHATYFVKVSNDKQQVKVFKVLTH